MKTHICTPTPQVVREAAALLRKGELVAFPTETVYGLGANAFDAQAVQKIFQVKGRHADNPLIVHVANIDQVKQLVQDISQDVEKVMQTCWPGPLTVVLKAATKIPSVVTAGLDTVAIRIPDNPVALALLKECGLPIAAPSANLSGHASPTTAQHVATDLGSAIPLILDGGPTKIGVESTVIDGTSSPVTVLRPGGLPYEILQKLLPDLQTTINKTTEQVKSPGMKYKHYAPNAPVKLFEGNEQEIFNNIQQTLTKHQGKKIVVLAAYPKHVYDTTTLFMGATPEEIAHNLFACFHRCDALDVDGIFVEGIPETGIGTAVMNRLRKTTQQ